MHAMHVAEEVGDEQSRMDSRVADALNDNTGRLKLFLNNLSAPRMPDDVGRIKTLRELYASQNPRLQSLPVSLAKLSNTLEILDVSNCDLDTLPEDLGCLGNLKVLKLANNNLTSFLWEPCSGFCDSLEHLDLRGNPIVYFSHHLQGLFKQLLVKEKAHRASRLSVENSLQLTTNPTSRFGAQKAALNLLVPSNHVDNALCATAEAHQLGELLPHFVENCSVCGKLVDVDRPAVFVDFVSLEVGVDANNGKKVLLRLPFFFPLCTAGDAAAECSLKLYAQRSVERQVLTALTGNKSSGKKKSK